MGNRSQGGPCEAFGSDTKVRIPFAAHTRFYYPDALVVCDGNPPNDTFQDRPSVLIEVLSPTTYRTDVGEKKDAYLTIPSVTGYLLVEQDRPRVIVYSRRGGDGVEAAVYEGMEAVIPLPAIGCDLPLVEIYDRSALSNA